MPPMHDDPPVTTASESAGAGLVPLVSTAAATTGRNSRAASGGRGSPAESLVASGMAQTGPVTHSNSTTMFSGELFLRVHAQNELVESIEDMLAQATEPGDDVTLTEVNMMLAQLEELHQTFRTEHSWLVNHWPPAHLDHSYFTRKVSSSESKLVLKVKRQLGRLQEKLTETTQAASSSEQTQRARSRHPELTVPTFIGDCRKWPDFKAMFTSVIGNRTDLSDLEKFQYLKSAIKDEASELIVNLAPNAAAYETAWSFLNARFENKRLIIKTHLERMLNLKPMTKRRAASLTKIVNIVNETTQSLKTLTTETNNDCLMVTIISGLLDQDTRERWETSLATTDEFPPLSQLTDFLVARARTLENIEESSAAPQSTSSEGATPKRANAHQASQQTQAGSAKTTSQTTQSTQPAQRRSPYPCDCCEQDHFIVTCPVLRDNTVDERLKVIKDRQLCYNCLGRHNARKCNNRTRCKVCSDAHHTMLHGGDLPSYCSSTDRAQSTQDGEATATSAAKSPFA